MYQQMLAAGEYSSAAEYDILLALARDEYEAEQAREEYKEELAREEAYNHIVGEKEQEV